MDCTNGPRKSCPVSNTSSNPESTETLIERVRYSLTYLARVQGRPTSWRKDSEDALNQLAERLAVAERKRDAWKADSDRMAGADVYLQRRAEAAERERDEWLTSFDGSGIEWHESLPNPYTYQASDFSKLVGAVHEYEARVKVLVEALEKIANEKRRMHPVAGYMFDIDPSKIAGAALSQVRED